MSISSRYTGKGPWENFAKLGRGFDLPSSSDKLSTVGLENFTTEKVHEYVFSTIIDSFHELNIHDWVV